MVRERSTDVVIKRECLVQQNRRRQGSQASCAHLEAPLGHLFLFGLKVCATFRRSEPEWQYLPA